MPTHRMIALFLLLVPGAIAYEDTCTTFSDIYKDGTELCEIMWDGAFKVTDDEDAYNMWFYDHENNPNDAVTRSLFGEEKTVDMCHLNYFHKDGPPSPEGNGMTECHPWKNNACCNKDTVGSADQLNEAYGEGYEWDRCGPMSQACERFFVMEACFYECEPAAGLYRKYNDTQQEAKNYNEWQLHQMPIKRSFCNSWYDACYNDYFCGKGSYFECSAYYTKNQELAAEKLMNETKLAAVKLAQEQADEKDKSDRNMVIGISVAGTVAGVVLVVAMFLIMKEKSGNPVFSPGPSQMS